MGIKNQLQQIKVGGKKVLYRKIRRSFKILSSSPLYVLALFLLLIIRTMKPLMLLRIGCLKSKRVGHFAANTELYCCDLDEGINTPNRFFADLFFAPPPVSNNQLLKMWKRVLHVYPTWLLEPIHQMNQWIPGGEEHDIPPPQHDRDLYNLYDKLSCHVQFTPEEDVFAEQEMRRIGVPDHTPFVCLIVRDDAYMARQFPQADWAYHNYRDTDVDNYVLASEALAERGYYVIRMGVHVRKPLRSDHPRVIDYAFNGLRTEFMDIWLAAHCAFCITVGSGIDTVSVIFRRPIVYVNYVPVGYFATWRKEFLGLFKHHYEIGREQELTLSEIVSSGVHLALRTSSYENKGIELRENTPEEIMAIALELADRIEGVWSEGARDKELQDTFWMLFPSDAKSEKGIPLHGDIRARYGSDYLRNNYWWLQ